MYCSAEVIITRNVRTVYVRLNACERDRTDDSAMWLQTSPATHPKPRTESGIIIASAPPYWHPVLVKEVVATCHSVRKFNDIVRQRSQHGAHRFLPSASLRILAMTPSLENRSCAPFTPGFLSGLHENRWFSNIRRTAKYAVRRDRSMRVSSRQAFNCGKE